MQKIISSIIKHLNIYKKEISQAGITIASINLLWFIRRFIPHALFSSIMERKHVLVERRIKGTIGGGNPLRFACRTTTTDVREITNLVLLAARQRASSGNNADVPSQHTGKQ